VVTDWTQKNRAYFGALGDPIEEILQRSDLYPREAKHQGAFCIQIDRADDVRILANVEPGERWLGTMLHELGHGVYDVAIERDLPWLLRRHAHIFATEAIAMLHGRATRDPIFLRTYCGLSSNLAEAPFNRAFIRRGLHVLAGWVQVMTRFERALYADPDADACPVASAGAARRGRLRGRQWSLLPSGQRPGRRRPPRGRKFLPD